MENAAIADNFDLLAKLMDIHGENSFKARTYGAAAFNIEKLPMSLKNTAREELSGIRGYRRQRGSESNRNAGYRATRDPE